jgi:hypothetical protein
VNLLALWIWVSAAATLIGWVLSAFGQLNRLGYAIAVAITAAILYFWRRPLGLSGRPAIATWKRVRRRFRRPLPLCFGILVALVFLGGVLYAPSNHTALSYRTARVLQWLSEGHWHWIHTPNYRMNDRACGLEWLSAPLLLFLRSDRPIFLLNFIPYLLLPGLVFSICRAIGVCGRVAWNWMWIFPTGYSFLLQAGSAGNDTFPAVYALAAIHYGFRAWERRRLSDLWLSALSVALLTGAKASNLPLVLPWVIVIFPLLRLSKQNPAGTVCVALVCLIVSFLPTALFNLHYCGDWSGLKMENTGMNMKNPVVGIWGNLFLFLLHNLVPPFFPMAGWWNAHALTLLPHWLVGPVQANFESGFHIVGELPTEDWVGLGMGVTLLAVISVAASLYYRQRFRASGCRSGNRALPEGIRKAFLISVWVALLAYCMKTGMVTGARLISPYYPLILPTLLLIRGQSRVVRTVWWSVLVWAVMLVAFPVLMLTPGRPLWPAQTVLTKLRAAHPQSHALGRALEVYTVYSIRPDPLANVRALLPPDLRVIGFMGAEDDIDISFWRPFGRHIVRHVLVADSPEWIRQSGIEYIVVGGFNLKLKGTTLEEWLQRTRAEVVASAMATVKVAEGPQTWYVVKLLN